MKVKRRTWLVLALVAFGLAVMAVAVMLPTHDANPGRIGHVRRAVFHLDTDHATYPALSEVAGGADVVIVGDILSSTTEPGESPGSDALGDPLPAIPHTNYSVLVEKVLKGTLSQGDVVIVSLAGGVSPSGKFVLDGVPEIHEGDVDMLFLESGNGKFYPLAGGAAVAEQSGGESFVLPADATGGEAATITTTAVEAALGSPAANQQPPTESPSSAPGKPKRKHCKPGFKKKRVKGHIRCVKAKKHRGHHKRHRSGA